MDNVSAAGRSGVVSGMTHLHSCQHGWAELVFQAGRFAVPKVAVLGLGQVLFSGGKFPRRPAEIKNRVDVLLLNSSFVLHIPTIVKACGMMKLERK